MSKDTDKKNTENKKTVTKKAAAKKTTVKKGKKRKLTKGQKALRVAVIVLMTLFLLVLVGIGAVYILLNRYTGMLDYVGKDNPDITLAPNETLPPDEGDDGYYVGEDGETYVVPGTDSPQEVVEAVEGALGDIANGGGNLPTVAPSSDVFNILLIGIDNRANKNSGRSDAMIIMSINQKTKQIVLTSLMRDIYVAIPGRANNRLNAAHAYGGYELLLQTIELNFGIHIDYFARVNFYSFIDIVEAAGGVDVTVDEKELPYVNSYLRSLNNAAGGMFQATLESDLLKEGQVGLLHLNGRQALAYSRIRYVGSDYARTARQREVIQAVAARMRSMGVGELDRFLQTALPLISTNLTQSIVNDLVLGVPSYLGYEIVECRIPADGTSQGVKINGMSVISIDFQANRNLLNEVIYGR